MGMTVSNTTYIKTRQPVSCSLLNTALGYMFLRVEKAPLEKTILRTWHTWQEISEHSLNGEHRTASENEGANATSNHVAGPHRHDVEQDTRDKRTCGLWIHFYQVERMQS